MVQENQAILTGYGPDVGDLGGAAVCLMSQCEFHTFHRLVQFIDLHQLQHGNTTVGDAVGKDDGINGFPVQGNGPGDLVAVSGRGHFIGHGVDRGIVIHIGIGACLLGDGIGVGAGLFEGQGIEGDDILHIGLCLQDPALCILQVEDEGIVPQLALCHLLPGSELCGSRRAELVGKGDDPFQMEFAGLVRRHILAVDGDGSDLHEIAFLDHLHAQMVLSFIIDEVRIIAPDFLDQVRIGARFSQRDGTEDKLAASLSPFSGSHIGLGIGQLVGLTVFGVQFKLESAVGNFQVGFTVLQVLGSLQDDLCVVRIHIDDLDRIYILRQLAVDVDLSVHIGHMAVLGCLVAIGLGGFTQDILVAGRNLHEPDHAVFIGDCLLISDLSGAALAVHMDQGKFHTGNRLALLVHLPEGEAYRHILLRLVDEHRCAAAGIGHGRHEGAVGIFTGLVRCGNGDGDLAGLTVIDHIGIVAGNLGDGVLVGTRLVKVQGRKAHMTPGIVFDGFHHIARFIR